GLGIVTADKILSFLTHAWRQPIPGWTGTLEPADVQRLVEMNVAPLCWKQIEKTPGARTRGGRQLRDWYLDWMFESRRMAILAQYFIDILHDAGIEPVVVKGWAVAQLYPDIALRPYADVDLCVEPSRLADAESAVRQKPCPGQILDLHGG